MKFNLHSVATREKIAAEIGKYHTASRLAPKGRLRLGELLERVRLRSFTGRESKDEHHPGCLALIKGSKRYVASAVLRWEKNSTWLRRTLIASPLAAEYKKALTVIGKRKSAAARVVDLVMPFPEWKALLFTESRRRFVYVVAKPVHAPFPSRQILPLHEFSDLFVRAELQRFEFMHRDSAERLVSTLRNYRVSPSKTATIIRATSFPVQE